MLDFDFLALKLIETQTRIHDAVKRFARTADLLAIRDFAFAGVIICGSIGMAFHSAGRGVQKEIVYLPAPFGQAFPELLMPQAADSWARAPFPLIDNEPAVAIEPISADEQQPQQEPREPRRRHRHWRRG